MKNLSIEATAQKMSRLEDRGGWRRYSGWRRKLHDLKRWARRYWRKR